MTQTEFETEMARLKGEWKTAYSPARIEIIAKEVKYLPAHWWKRTVDRFLGEFRQAPLIPEIREAIARERERGWESQKVVPIQAWQEPKGSKCWQCRDLGYLIAFTKTAEAKAPHAFKCNCEMGRRSRHAFPDWGNADLSQWEVK